MQRTLRFHNTKVVDLRLIDVDLEQKPGPKPRGFWYDVGGEWLAWMKEEAKDWIQPVWFDVVIPSTLRMLVLRGASDLDEFTRRYAVKDDKGFGYFNEFLIDWPRVAAEYDGIEIASYVWSRRFDLLWYYGYDCACGCVWRRQSELILTPVPRESVERLLSGVV